MKKNILLIIPAYNEENSILNTINDIRDYIKGNLNVDYIVINDGSTDFTKRICEENNIKVISLIHNLGIGGAVQTGYKYAYENNYDIAIQVDGDGQHDINYIKDIIKPIEQEKVDLVIGSRFTGNESEFKSTMARRIGINIISFLIKIFARTRIYDTTSGFRACNRDLIEKFAQEYPTEYPEPISTVNILKQGYKIKEVPVRMKERMAGKSSIKTWKTAYYMINVTLSIIIASLRRYK